jgi:NAD(P)-dependent dehydrogenase (short-subunit alcohol dehydrogenase family)/predicted anti-sigma-YlaC factor YlaD
VGVAPCDLLEPAGFGPALDRAAAALGGLDAVVVTAGAFGTQEALEQDAALRARVLAVNFAGTMELCEAARLRLLAGGGGTLCVFSSVAGDRARRKVVLYGATKAGLSYYLDGLDARFRRDGLRTVCVKPGFVRTAMTAGLPEPPFAADADAVAARALRAIDHGWPVVYAPPIWRSRSDAEIIFPYPLIGRMREAMRRHRGARTRGEPSGARSGSPRRAIRGALAIAAAIALAGSLGGCSARRLAVRQVAGALAAGGTTWSADDDPALVGEALPFALKTHESLLAELPDDGPLLLATCRGFVSYAAGWIEAEAEQLERVDYDSALVARRRALGLHLRARDYCLRALELRSPGVGATLRSRPDDALGWALRDDVERLYWTAAAWGSAIALGLDRPELVADLPAVRALFARALALDPQFDRGALHEAMIAIESVSELLGGSRERAQLHFARAVELSGGERAGPYVALARGVSIAAQDRDGFRRLLGQALAVDLEASPADRLANRLAQARAQRLLDLIDDYFFAED